MIEEKIKNLKTVSSMWTQNHKNEALQATNVMKDYTYEDLTNITRDDAGNVKMISAIFLI